ncbi:hypothetical protein BN7_5567 [Wickerhamomyces ciferrii]|uniref:ERCC4 domain-containing protein n=1 Tax=Wickerhamomyces ciferrii (strain ATCC 14091 / BCRC 22168 / CBS 111 / JCM 3599 / NBRC 0793 / NRRL Y-1031 F-60-10) TaxID=1206466 RepID=K0KL61_WICCF|nr:uncharacterized protein BN7_5567 [Wickerhamomyces ciferrii]CCH45980.1 hypothetical protein BN7_5567 [Wickerhamomyces ciferrii]
MNSIEIVDIDEIEDVDDGEIVEIIDSEPEEVDQNNQTFDIIPLDSSPINSSFKARDIKGGGQGGNGTGGTAGDLLTRILEDSDDEITIRPHKQKLFVPSSNTSTPIKPQKVHNKDISNTSIIPISSSSQHLSKPTRTKFLSSSQDKIDSSSSIGEIRQTKSKIQPIYPIYDLDPNHNIELSDDDNDQEEEDQDDDDENSPNKFLNKLTKLTNNNKKRSKHIKAQSELEKLKYEEKNDYNWPKPIDYSKPSPKQQEKQLQERSDLSSDPIQDISFNKKSFSETELPNINPISSRPTKRNNTTNTTTTKLTKEEKELLKRQKLQDKFDKQQYQEANRVNRKKDDLLNEMILKLPQGIINEFKKIDNYEIELNPIHVEPWNQDLNCISWFRKINSIYEPNEDCFKPISNQRIIQENQCVLCFTAQEFILMMELETLLNKFQNFQKSNPQYKNIIILIIEYDSFLQKLKVQENRTYTAKVRSRMTQDESEPQPGQTTKRRKTTKSKTLTTLSSEEIESEISNLQVNGFKIFPTKNLHETLIWLKSMTYTISSSRYDKFERNQDLANIGTIKSGSSTHDTYLKMLLQFKFMTEIKANRIIDSIPSLGDLYKYCTRGYLPKGADGKNLVNKNVENSIIKLFSTLNDGELIER